MIIGAIILVISAVRDSCSGEIEGMMMEIISTVKISRNKTTINRAETSPTSTEAVNSQAPFLPMNLQKIGMNDVAIRKLLRLLNRKSGILKATKNESVVTRRRK